MPVHTSLLQLVATPDRAWLMLLAGSLLLSREFIAPGRVLPGVLGGVAMVLAVHALLTGGYRLNSAGAGMLGGALMLLVLQARWPRPWCWVGTGAASVLAAAGARWLVAASWQISPGVALATIPDAALLGFLANTAVRAYANKVSGAGESSR